MIQTTSRKSCTLNHINDKQILQELMNLSLDREVKFIDGNNDTEMGTGFFELEEINKIFSFECTPGTSLNYWLIVCLAIKGMDITDKLHYYRTVMQVNKQNIVEGSVYGDWDKMELGYSRGLSYGIDYQGKLCIYVLDYSVVRGKGFAAKLTALGSNRRHEEFAFYPALSQKKSLVYNKLLDVSLPKVYYIDNLLNTIPFKIYDCACSVEFSDNGVAKGTIKEQAYEAVFPIIINKPDAKVAVNVVASIEITATLLVGEQGGRIINTAARRSIEQNLAKDKYKYFLSNKFEGLLQILYSSKIEGYIFKKCGMLDKSNNPIGVVYFVG